MQWPNFAYYKSDDGITPGFKGFAYYWWINRPRPTSGRLKSYLGHNTFILRVLVFNVVLQVTWKFSKVLPLGD